MTKKNTPKIKSPIANDETGRNNVAGGGTLPPDAQDAADSARAIWGNNVSHPKYTGDDSGKR